MTNKSTWILLFSKFWNIIKCFPLNGLQQWLKFIGNGEGREGGKEGRGYPTWARCARAMLQVHISQGHFKETVKNVLAPQEAINLFERVFGRPFKSTHRGSPNFRRFLTLDVMIKKEEETRKRKRAVMCSWVKIKKYFSYFVKGRPPAEWCVF